MALKRWPHPDVMLDELTWEQFVDWQEFYDVDPWGDQRADLRSVAHASMILGAFAGSDRMPDPTFPYFSGDGGAVDLSGTAEALERHLERMLATLIVTIGDARAPSQVAMEPGEKT